MYYNISELNDVNMMTGGTISKLKKNNVIILVKMNGCMHCDMMKNEWRKMVVQKRNESALDILEIESNMMMPLLNKDKGFFEPQFKGIQGFPSIFMKDRDEKTIPFENRRSSSDFIDFIEKHSIKPVIHLKKPIKIMKIKTPTTTKSEAEKKKSKAAKKTKAVKTEVPKKTKAVAKKTKAVAKKTKAVAKKTTK